VTKTNYNKYQGVPIGDTICPSPMAVNH